MKNGEREIKKAIRTSNGRKLFDERVKDKEEDDSVSPKTPPRGRRLYRMAAKHSEYDFQEKINQKSEFFYQFSVYKK